MDFYTLVLYTAGVVTIVLPVVCYFFYLYTKCCPPREPPLPPQKPSLPSKTETSKIGCRRIMCETQEAAERKARHMSNGADPVLDPPDPHNTSYHYHLSNRAKVLVRGRIVNYEFLFPGLPKEEDLQMLERKREAIERRKALLNLQLPSSYQNAVSNSNGPSTDSSLHLALFSDDENDYDLIDDGDSFDDIRFLDL